MPMVVFLSFVSLIFELFGLMYAWGVSLNSISMIIIVMAIGFAVDYSAHIAHAFAKSTAGTSEQRAINALSTMGSSVTMGGMSTLVGMLITAFASSAVFRIFFKMMFGIVGLGLLHGLVFLPVLMALFSPNFSIDEQQNTAAAQNETEQSEALQTEFKSP